MCLERAGLAERAEESAEPSLDFLPFHPTDREILERLGTHCEGAIVESLGGEIVAD